MKYYLFGVAGSTGDGQMNFSEIAMLLFGAAWSAELSTEPHFTGKFSSDSRRASWFRYSESSVYFTTMPQIVVMEIKDANLIVQQEAMRSYIEIDSRWIPMDEILVLPSKVKVVSIPDDMAPKGDLATVLEGVLESGKGFLISNIQNADKLKIIFKPLEAKCKDSLAQKQKRDFEEISQHCQ